MSDPTSVRILVAEDEPALAGLVSEFLAGRGHRVAVAADGRAALDLLRTQPFDVALLDLVMPGLDGLEVLRAVQREVAPPECIIITGAGTIETAIAAMRLGAYDYVGKPYRMAEIDALVRRAAEKRRLAAENRRMASRLERLEGESCVESIFAPMVALLSMARRLAPAGVPVLVNGAPGTGKSSLARFLHRHSGRNGPLVEVSARRLGRGAGAAALVGTAADGDGPPGPGLLEHALGGTLLVDDVDALEPAAQAALAGALEHGAFHRLGARQEIEAEVRMIATTATDLDAAVGRGTFRPDLRDRFAQAVLTLPALVERRVDIPRLAEAMLRDLAGPRAVALSADAIYVLQQYRWPGNLRELRNVLERALMLSGDGEVRAHDLALAPLALIGAGEAPAVSLADMERRHIAEVLQDADWHQGRAAARLGISAKTLYRKIREFGFLRPSNRTTG